MRENERKAVLFRMPQDRYQLVCQLARSEYRRVNQQLLMLIDEALSAKRVAPSEAQNEECKE